jgi:hypothetical protein
VCWQSAHSRRGVVVRRRLTPAFWPNKDNGSWLGSSHCCGSATSATDDAEGQWGRIWSSFTAYSRRYLLFDLTYLRTAFFRKS